MKRKRESVENKLKLLRDKTKIEYVPPYNGGRHRAVHTLKLIGTRLVVPDVVLRALKAKPYLVARNSTSASMSLGLRVFPALRMAHMPPDGCTTPVYFPSLAFR